MRWLLLCLCLFFVSRASAADQSRAPNCVRATLTTPGYWGWGPKYLKPDGYWYQDWTYFPGNTRSGYFCEKSCERYTISDEREEEEAPPPNQKKKKKPCQCGCAKSKPSISSREIEVVDDEVIETHPRVRFRW